MCLLIVAPAGHTPDRDRIIEASRTNDDGYGFAIDIGGRIAVIKGLDLDPVLDSYLLLRDLYPQGNSIFHLRYSTHGKNSTDNCHPYRVAKRDDVVMGHNGILPVDIEAGDHRSDSRVFAEDWVGEWGVRILNDSGFRSEAEAWMGTGNKLAFLSVAEEVKHPLLILNEGVGHWDEGCWWSNYNYRKPVSTYSGYGWSRGGWSGGGASWSGNDDKLYEQWWETRAADKRFIEDEMSAGAEPDEMGFILLERDGKPVVGQMLDNGIYLVKGSGGGWMEFKQQAHAAEEAQADAAFEESLSAVDYEQINCWQCGVAGWYDMSAADDHRCFTCHACIWCGGWEPKECTGECGVAHYSTNGEEDDPFTGCGNCTPSYSTAE